MEATVPSRIDPALLQTLEVALASHRAFGDSDYIQGQMAACYKRRLQTLSDALPVAGQLLESLSAAPQEVQRGLIGDTVLRCAIQHAQRQITTGEQYGLPLEQCCAMFLEGINNVGAGRTIGPLALGLPPAPRLEHSWIWSEEHANDVTGQAFRLLMQENYGSPLCTPSAHETAGLLRGWSLLQTLLPLVSRSALRHVQMIALFPKVGVWREKASSSQFRLNGTLFLSRGLVGNPWWVAEHLLHESLHQKLYDFRQGHTLLALDYHRDDAPRICSLWNAPDESNSNHWDAHRSIAAFHVYVHLALLCTLAEQREAELAPEYGAIGNMMSGSRRAIDRSRYLGEQIRGIGWSELGEAGKRMVNWLIAVLDALDAAPRPTGAYSHLSLDLYQRQTKKVEKFCHAGASDDAAPRLQQCLRQEIAATEMALSTAAASLERQRFSGELDKLLHDDAASGYAPARKLIFETLSTVGEAQDRRAASNATAQVIRAMVEQSSRQLAEIGVFSQAAS